MKFKSWMEKSNLSVMLIPTYTVKPSIVGFYENADEVSI